MEPFCYFEECIFCSKPLPIKGDRGTKGEHIFPENIQGFWKSFDICEDCKEYFGDKVDSIPLKNPEIIAAVKNLELNKKKSFGQGLKYKASSDLSEHPEEIDLYDKKGKMHVSAKEISEDKFNCDESDTHKVGLDYVQKYRSEFFDENEIREEFKILLEKYGNLKSGEKVYSEKLKIWMKKGKLKEFKINKDSVEDATPLIAKILIFVINYFFKPDIPIIKNYPNILNYALGKEDLEEYIIFWSPEPVQEYSKFHRITIEFLPNNFLIDISLFRCLNWRILLPTTQDYVSNIYYDKNETFELKEIIFVLDFEKLDDKKIHFYYREKDSDILYEIDVNSNI